MRILLPSLLFLFVSCTNGGAKEIKSTEEKAVLPVQSATSERTEHEIAYENHAPCSFSVDLPQDFTLEETYGEDDNPDMCDYDVKTADGTHVMELHSLLGSRFETNAIDELYKMAVDNSKFQVSYKVKKGNWFVVSGVNPETGNIIYWKRVVGEQFISDLYFDYPKSKKAEVEPHIGRIAESFTSE